QDILLLHDGHAARDAHGAPVLLTVLPKVLETAARAQLQCTTLRAALPAQPAQPARPQMAI
ncbi:MAG: polysaccharide deacetylase family protein, partial [Ralstonia sp.]|nr:polysaccharide deacetylase family protein [Ralstonia sp.]